MIDEKKLIEDIHCYFKNKIDNDESEIIDNGILTLNKEICGIIKKQPKLNEWIPCSERLPEKYMHCLVTRRNDYKDGSFDSDVREDCYIELEGVWDWHSKFEGLIDNIIAWMPMPEPYTGKEVTE